MARTHRCGHYNRTRNSPLTGASVDQLNAPDIYPMNTIMSLTDSHLQTYNRLFQHPTLYNIEWREVIAMLRDLCHIEEKPNGSLRCTRRAPRRQRPPHIGLARSRHALRSPPSGGHRRGRAQAPTPPPPLVLASRRRSHRSRHGRDGAPSGPRSRRGRCRRNDLRESRP